MIRCKLCGKRVPNAHIKGHGRFHGDAKKGIYPPHKILKAFLRGYFEKATP